MHKKFVALKPFNNKAYYKNAIFNEHSNTGSTYLIAAKKLLAKRNIIINTMDITLSLPSQKDVYMDVPYPWDLRHWIRIIKNINKNILFIVEPPIVNPFNFMKVFHLFFSKVYTQKDELIDDVRYFKFFLPKTRIGLEPKQVPFKDKKLLVLMNGNLSAFLPFRLFALSTRELYTERIKAIDFFDSNYSTDFYLYGRGWNKPRKFSISQRLFGYKKYKTYQGEFHSKDKYKILSEFKFSLCFENCETNGYISEKIIDSFKARCIPIYLGTPNITDYISRKCFIDFRRFKSYKELGKFLETLDEKTYNAYIREIEKFLMSRGFGERWSTDAFGRLFLKSIT